MVEGIHPIKAAWTAALCWVFSIVQRKDRPSCGTALPGFSAEGAGRLPGRPEQNTVPMKGDAMSVERAGNDLPAFIDQYHIYFVHTAALSKGAAAFFYSTYFYNFSQQTIKGYIVFITGVPAIMRVRLFFALSYIYFPPFRGRAPPFQS